MTIKSPNGIRIERLTIESFRGVPGLLEVDLTGSAGAPCSLLIVGDNGSGKSTIADALEFALQGRIGRAGSLGARGVPSALSLRKGSSARVAVHFADATVTERIVSTDDDGVLQYNRTPERGFGLSPLILRRSDILQFWETPDENKQMLFFEYFRSEGQAVDPRMSASIKELQEEYYAAKLKRTEALGNLGALCGHDALMALSEETDLEQWITKYVYSGVTSDQRERLKNRGTALKIPVAKHKLVWEVRNLTQRISTLKKDIRRTSAAAKANVPTARASATNRGLAQVSEFVTQAFAALSTASSFVEGISLELGKLTTVSLSIEVRLRNGGRTSPIKVFSEANLDLLAVLIYVGVARQAAERGQARILVLDDVLQSVDGATRLRATEFILAALDGWQCVFTLHDRLWGEQLKGVLKRLNNEFVEREIRRWTFDGGPEIVRTGRTPTAGVDRALLDGEVYQICSEAGLLLERLSGHLSYTLPISVVRRRDDKYTLGDLWPGVLKALRKTTLRDLADNVERWVHLRNLLGAHFNEWANTLGRSEAEQFGTAVRDFAVGVWCAECGLWTEPVRQGSSRVTRWSCRCGSVAIALTNEQ